MNVIKKYRLKRNWTRQQLADKLGVTHQTIHNYETYNREPKFVMVKKLSKELRVSIMRIVLDFIKHNEEL